MAWFRRTERRSFEPAFRPTTERYDGPFNEGGERVDHDRALRHNAVWASVRLLSETVATLPLDVYDAGTRRQVDLPELLRTPAAGMGLPDWLGQVMVSLLLRGNAYGVVIGRSGLALAPTQVEIVSPDRMQVTTTPDGRIEYRLGGQVVDRSDVWHLRGLQSPGCHLGLSPVEYARQTIGLGLAVEHYGSRWFSDNGMPSGVITTAADLSQDEVTRLQSSWYAARARTKVAVMTGGGTFTPLSLAPDESQFVESRRLSVSEVARIFGVPPEMIGGESGGSLTYSNVEQRSLDFLTYSVGPWLARIEAAVTLLIPGFYCKFNTGALIRTDLKTRYEAHAIALASGFLTVDEVRELEDRPPLPRLVPVRTEVVA